METVWWLFGVLGWVIAILLALALMHMAGRQDNIARDVEMRIRPGRAEPPRGGSGPEGEHVQRRAVDGSENC